MGLKDISLVFEGWFFSSGGNPGAPPITNTRRLPPEAIQEKRSSLNCSLDLIFPVGSIKTTVWPFSLSVSTALIRSGSVLCHTVSTSRLEGRNLVSYIEYASSSHFSLPFFLPTIRIFTSIPIVQREAGTFTIRLATLLPTKLDVIQASQPIASRTKMIQHVIFAVDFRFVPFIVQKYDFRFQIIFIFVSPSSLPVPYTVYDRLPIQNPKPDLLYHSFNKEVENTWNQNGILHKESNNQCGSIGTIIQYQSGKDTTLKFLRRGGNPEVEDWKPHLALPSNVRYLFSRKRKLKFIFTCSPANCQGPHFCQSRRKDDV